MLLMRNVSGFLCTGVLLAVSGCGDSNSAPTADAGGDTTNDATVDGSAGGSDSGGALHDSGVVPGVDASDDATTDDPPTDDDDASATDDTSTDDGSNPGQDASVPVADGGTDVSNDSGSSEDSGAEDGDAQAPPPDQGWSGCPSAESVVQDPSSPLTLEVTQDAIYCATYNETRTLKEELAAKMQLRLTPGTYQVPNEAGAWTLPACLKSPSGEVSASSGGQSEYSSTSFEDTTSHTFATRTTFGAEQSPLLRVRLDATTDAASAPGFTVDGVENGMDFDAYQSFELCDEAGEDCFPDRIFDSCSYESGVPNLHEVTLDTGTVTFELRLGDSFAGTEPGAYVRASGEFKGVVFDQSDYFKLIYHPTHHHFERAFVVLFDSPVDGACGIEVSALEPFGDDVPDEAFTVDCALNRLEPLTVVGHELTR